MKRIRTNSISRILSWPLTISLLIASIPTCLPTAAQTPAANNVQTVVVIDFDNKASSGGQPLTRLATDAVAVELGNSERFAVLTREEVRKQTVQLGLKPPYDQVALARLTSALGATGYVDGEISYVHVDTKKSPKTVDVGLKIRIHDAATGELIAGAAQVGSAAARPGQSDNDSLTQEAIGNAAVLGVRSILNVTLPEGIVLTTVGSGSGNTQVLINRGSRDGLVEGMDMLVLREHARVGRIRVTQVFPTDSEARILDNTLGIRPEDHVRAVFPMPDFAANGRIVQPGHHRSSSSLSVLGKVLLVILAGVIIAQAARGGGSVTGVTAEPDIQNGAPAVRITWRDNLFGGGTQEYHLWRTPGASFNLSGYPVAAVGGGQHQVSDFPSPFTNWNGVNSFLQAPTSTTTGSNLATKVTPTAGSPPLGFTIGSTFTYQITAIVRRTLSSSSSSSSTQEDVETSVVSSGPATPVTKPLLSTPSAGQTSVSLSSVNFVWQSVSGADVFQVEISTDQTFTDKTRILQLALAFSTAPSATGVAQTLSAPIDLTNSSINAPLRRDPAFSNFVNRVPGAATPTLFWRVGARNNNDRPGPVNWISKSSSDSDRAFRFIYSQPNGFQPAALPPAPP